MNMTTNISPRKYECYAVKPQKWASLDENHIAGTKIALKGFKCLEHVGSDLMDRSARHPRCSCARTAGLIDLITTDKDST
jgi:hypothetical protein